MGETIDLVEYLGRFPIRLADFHPTDLRDRQGSAATIDGYQDEFHMIRKGQFAATGAAGTSFAEQFHALA